MLHLKRLLVGITHITVPTASDSPTAYVITHTKSNQFPKNLTSTFSPSATEIYIGVVWLSISAILKFSNIDITKCSWPPKTTIGSLMSLGWR